jgi:hypothetical protein
MVPFLFYPRLSLSFCIEYIHVYNYLQFHDPIGLPILSVSENESFQKRKTENSKETDWPTLSAKVSYSPNLFISQHSAPIT